MRTKSGRGGCIGKFQKLLGAARIDLGELEEQQVKSVSRCFDINDLLICRFLMEGRNSQFIPIGSSENKHRIKYKTQP